MEKEFTPYKQALELKELGCDEPCFACYTTDGELSYDFSDNQGERHYFQECSAPTFSQAFRWFRKNHNLSGEVYSENFGGCIEYSFHIRDLYTEEEIFDNFFGTGVSYSGTFKTYEETELACLKKLIEIVKTK